MEKMDYKKQYKDMYLPKTDPMTIDVPSMNFIMVTGKGNPNEENGEYSKAVELLYALSFTIKMSKQGKAKPPGYFEYVVPPLEGLWWTEDKKERFRYPDKDKFCWISMIRQPEFVTRDIFLWACDEVMRKKQLDTGAARFETWKEGLCVQCMHIGPFDEEPETILKLEQYILGQNLKNDINDNHRHHEIYLSDPRKCNIARMKTVIRIPVR